MLPKLICLLVLAASSLVCVRAAVNDTGELRLPGYVTPIHYDLFLKVFFQVYSNETERTDRFVGQADIDIIVGEQTDRILFHADYSLKLTLIEIVNLKGQLISLDVAQYQQIGNQLYAVTLEEKIEVGQYKLKISYEGDYGGAANIIGFYKTKYEEDGITKAIVATKFQPTDARKAFPCFDEPALKATFSIKIEHPENSMALSNWPVLAEDRSQFRVVTQFEKTDPMSTYLAAWTVLPKDFGFKTVKTTNGKPITVYARKNAVQSGLVDFALEVAQKSIDYFENNYFDGLDEALPPKIDMLAFPDFPSGAMEHWGLIGYRETNLLFSDKGASASSKQSVAFVIAHELSHFWFGNLVTCKWWNDLWLNEAMARFLQFKAIHHIYPDWNVDDQFLTLYEIPVMFDDAVPSSSPVAAEVNTPAEINSAFSSITYDKGSSLLRMLEDTVGEENFRVGLNEYIRANKFQAAEAAAFYNSLRLPDIMQSAGVTPQQYMENWLLEPNYPEVFAVLDKDPNNAANTKVFLGQRRVLLQQNDNSSDLDKYFWMIYMKCKAGKADGSVSNLEVFLNTELTTKTLEGEHIWIKCNNDFKGFYASFYSPSNYQALSNLLKVDDGQVFSPADRANILNDAFLSAFASRREYSSVMSAVSYLKNNENSYVPWRTFTWHISKLASILEHRSSFEELSEFGLKVASAYTDVNFLWEPNPNNHDEQLKHSSFAEFVGRMQNSEELVVIRDLYEALIFDDYFTDPTSTNNEVNPNVRSTIYNYAVQNELGSKKWKQLFNLYSISIDPQEKANALNAIAYTKQVWLLEKLLGELLADNSKIRAQDFFTLLNAISRNPVGRPLAWQFLRSQWDAIVKKFQLSNRTLASTTKTICETFATEFLYEEMENFFYWSDPGAGKLQRQQARDIVIHNIKWIENKEQDLIESIRVFLWINQSD